MREIRIRRRLLLPAEGYSKRIFKRHFRTQAQGRCAHLNVRESTGGKIANGRSPL
jgi:hypothetical protein